MKTEKEKLVIWGASGHALVVADLAELDGGYDLVGYLDSMNPERKGTSLNGSPILGGEECLKQLRDGGVTHIAWGFGDCAARLELAEKVKSLGFVLATLIHPTAAVAASVQIGEGTIVMANSVLNVHVQVGHSVIINSCATVGHEDIVEDGAHICPGVNLSGNVHIGRGVWVGIGASVVNRVRIGSYSFIGAGSVVVSDIPDGVLAYGIPAKVIRKVNQDGRQYSKSAKV